MTPVFKVGDRVVVADITHPGDSVAEYIGRSGRVEEVDDDDDLFPLMVRFSDGLMDFHWFKICELEAVR